MKKLITILFLFIGSLVYSQEQPYGMVKISYDTILYNYNVEYYRQILEQDVVEQVLQDRRINRDYSIFIRENFGQINIIYNINHLDVPQPDTYNSYEYIKTTQFNPQKSLQEILRGKE